MLACVTGIEAGAQDLAAALRVCSAIESAAERLACFDALARDTHNAAPVAASPAPVVPTAAPAPPVPTVSTTQTPSVATQPPPAPAPPPVVSTADFGIEHRTSTHPAGETLSATLAVVEDGGYGQLRVTLDNGQIWEQVGSDRYQLKVGDQVVIERGRFNSFFLRKHASDRKVRFTRLN